VVGTAASSASRAGTILAFDFGTRRIGVAVGERSIGLAHPLATIAGEQNERRFAAIESLIEEWHPALLVVGLPVHADGTEHALTARARRFAKQLEGRFGLTAKLVDERFTTHAAGAALSDAGVKARAQKGVRDQVAAQLILQTYFDQREADQGN
jgi:putative Holliday junction resolvase